MGHGDHRPERRPAAAARRRPSASTRKASPGGGAIRRSVRAVLLGGGTRLRGSRRRPPPAREEGACRGVQVLRAPAWCRRASHGNAGGLVVAVGRRPPRLAHWAAVPAVVASGRLLLVVAARAARRSNPGSARHAGRVRRASDRIAHAGPRSGRSGRELCARRRRGRVQEIGDAVRPRGASKLRHGARRRINASSTTRSRLSSAAPRRP